MLVAHRCIGLAGAGVQVAQAGLHIGLSLEHGVFVPAAKGGSRVKQQRGIRGVFHPHAARVAEGFAVGQHAHLRIVAHAARCVRIAVFQVIGRLLPHAQRPVHRGAVPLNRYAGVGIGHLRVHRGAEREVELQRAGVVAGKAHHQHVVRGAYERLAHKMRAVGVVFHRVDARGEVQRAHGVLHLCMAQVQQQVAQRQVDLRGAVGELLLEDALRLGVFAVHHQLLRLFIGLVSPGAVVVLRIAAPQRVLVEAHALVDGVAVHHRAQPPVAQRQRLVPAHGALPVPDQVRSVVLHVGPTSLFCVIRGVSARIIARNVLRVQSCGGFCSQNAETGAQISRFLLVFRAKRWYTKRGSRRR